MIIAFDCRPLMGGKLSGVELYTRNLLSHMLVQDTANKYVLFMNASAAQLQYLPDFNNPNVIKIQTRIPNKILNFCLFVFKRPRLDRLIWKALKKSGHAFGKADLFFMPDLRPFSVSRTVKTIGVVHDLSFHHFPQYFSGKTRLWHKLLNARKLLRKMNKIIAVSAFTKKDIMDSFRIEQSKISVIHEGIENDFCVSESGEKNKNVKLKYKLPPDYFLFLSTLEPRKNLVRIIEGFRIYKEKNNDAIKLVLVGKESNIFSRLHLQKHPDIIMTGFVEEEDKPYVFKGAKAFLYPSLFEGFGLPLLEAMKCGTPVITSNTSSMPEVCGQAALYVNPQSAEEIAAAMADIQNPDTINSLKTLMSQQIKNYSWEKCAAETLRTIRAL